MEAAGLVQRAMQLCQGLACDMTTADPSLGKEMGECDVSAGVSIIKTGDSTPVTAADFAIQGMVAAALKKEFPDDRFMGEEDAEALREDRDLCNLAMDLAAKYAGPMTKVGAHKDEFLEAVDSGLEPPRGKGERVWVLDPIDGTKGFMTGQGYVIGLALLVDGVPVVGVMGVPNHQSGPPIMCAVKGHGLRWWPAEGQGPLAYEAPKPDWAKNSYSAPFDGGAAGKDYPPWLLSPQTARERCTPFGAEASASDVCCGAMIKYFAVAEGSHSGFVQFEESLKTWDHACGVICVAESGGLASATDAEADEVLFPDRTFKVKGGIVCASRWTPLDVRECLLNAAKANQAA